MKIVELGTVANVSWGDTSVTKKSYVDSGFPAYSATGQDGFLPDYDFDETGIVLSAIGARCGKCFKATGRWKAIKNTITITPTKEPKVDIDYLFYITNDEAFWPKRGVAQPFIGLGDARKVKIPLPPLAEQKRIAGILDAADALRAKRREALAQLDTLLQATFLNMFGDPVTNPMGWTVRELQDVTSKITDGIHFRPKYTEAGVPFISVKDITTGELRFDDTKFVSAVDHQKMIKRCHPERGDILYTKVGATYGRPALVDTDKEFSLYVSVALLKTDQSLVDPEFLCTAMGTDAVKRQADRSIKGIGVPDLHLNMIRKFLVPVPPIKEQRSFLNFVHSIKRQRARFRRHLVELDALFASLQSRAFNGEL